MTSRLHGAIGAERDRGHHQEAADSRRCRRITRNTTARRRPRCTIARSTGLISWVTRAVRLAASAGNFGQSARRYGQNGLRRPTFRRRAISDRLHAAVDADGDLPTSRRSPPGPRCWQTSKPRTTPQCRRRCTTATLGGLIGSDPEAVRSVTVTSADPHVGHGQDRYGDGLRDEPALTSRLLGAGHADSELRTITPIPLTATIAADTSCTTRPTRWSFYDLRDLRA